MNKNERTPCPLKIGDVVQIKSNSSPMTITDTEFVEEANAYYCAVVYHRYRLKYWFRKVYDEYMIFENFPAEALTKCKTNTCG